MRTILSYTVLGLLALSCNDHKIKYETLEIDNKKSLIKRVYDNRNEIVSEELLNEDSVRNGFYKEYDIGKIKLIGTYANNKKEGLWIYYDVEGDTIKKENWFSGKQFGKQIEYYLKTAKNERKSLIYKFTFFNINGHETFNSKFDINGRVLNLSGTPFYYAYNSDSLSINNEFELILFFSSPPNYTSEIVIEELSSDTPNKSRRVIIKDTTTEVLNLNFANKYYHTRKYIKQGLYNWRINYIMKDSLNRVVVKNISELPVRVVL